MSRRRRAVQQAGQGAPLEPRAALALADCADVGALAHQAAALRDQGHGRIISYSPKVFIPLTRLCRDVCHYCTFAQPPRAGQRAYLGRDEVLAVARAGAAAGCHEALFTLGDRPELRYRQARDELRELGHASTLSYLQEMARLVLDETSLLPHLNPGVMSLAELRAARAVSASQGLMLEGIAPRLQQPGGPHHGSPDKAPAVRLAAIAAAGAARVPFTSGILIGIGETRRERLEAMLALRQLHETHGHLQEIIIQNFRRKPGTKMRRAPEPTLEELVWTIAAARLVFGAKMNIQAPPNLSPGALSALIDAGINDWGGVSPVTPDHVNPEAPWPHLQRLRAATAAAGKTLVPRLPVYPQYVLARETWLDPALHARVLRATDAAGFARPDPWCAGAAQAPPRPAADPTGSGFPARHPEQTASPASRPPADPTGPGSARSPGRDASPVPRLGNPLSRIIDRATAGQRLAEADLERLFTARGADYALITQVADELRRQVNGAAVTYVVNRNINYTNICYFGCGFCAFSKGRVAENLRERGYRLGLDEIQARVRDAWRRGATEVCLQGGIHPEYSGADYLAILRAVKQAEPRMHAHAFSPLEIRHGAQTLGLSLSAYLEELQGAGLATLPGTAAEILDDEVRRELCPDKLNTAQWLEVMRTAHGLGLKSTATIMFGHVDAPRHWARHLLRVRDLQEETGGFTEFVPLPFVHAEAPLYRRGRARRGPTFREAVLMHALARLALHPLIVNIQVSWVKMGAAGARVCLDAGVNDLGGTLMNESISRAAGAAHGQELPAERMREIIIAAGRTPRQRTTTYQPLDAAVPRRQRRAPAVAAAGGVSAHA